MRREDHTPATCKHPCCTNVEHPWERYPKCPHCGDQFCGYCEAEHRLYECALRPELQDPSALQVQVRGAVGSYTRRHLDWCLRAEERQGDKPS